MSIRSKIILSISFSAIFAFLVGYVLFVIVAIPFIEDMERKQLLKDITRLNLIVEQDFARFESIATDWGFWNDTYEFVQDRNQSYIVSNFKEIWLEKYGADLLNVKSWNNDWDATLISEQSPLDLQVLERLPHNFRQDTGAGIVVIDGKPLLLGFSKIKGSDGQRPSEGVVILAKVIDQAWLAELGDSFGADISMTVDRTLAAPRVKFLNEEFALVQASLPVLNQENLSPQVSIRESREWRRELNRSLLMVIMSALLLFVIFTLSLYVSLDHFLVKPLRRVRNGILSITGASPSEAMEKGFEWNHPDDLEALQLITDAAGNILISQRESLRQQRDMFERQSLLDELTGLYNRRGLNQIFAQRYRRSSNALCCVIFDLDHFKRINDTYGHDAGDRALISFADILRKVFDDDAIIARSGGEEFTLISPMGTDNLMFSRLCTLQKKTEQELSSRAGLASPVTVSSGFVVSLEDSGWALGDFMRLADFALYEAKKTRNMTLGYQQLEKSDLPQESTGVADILRSNRFERQQPCLQPGV
ncbi:diguanylate cyclase [Marinobacter szutsaonensis]